MRLNFRGRGLALLGAASALTLTVAGAALAAPSSGSSGSGGVQLSSGSVPPSSHYAPGRYIVLLRQAPASTYAGGVRGFAPTTRPDGTFLAGRAETQRYTGLLERRQGDLAARYGVRIAQRYTTTLNGFAAHLSSAQATGLSKSSAVLAVTPDRIVRATRTPRVGPNATSGYLGLTRAGLPARGWNPRAAGKGVVIGDIDTGYWPESPSFAGPRLLHRRSVSKRHPGPIWVGGSHRTRFLKGDGSRFNGSCQAGERFAASTCNTKVISARYFDQGFKADVPTSQWASHEFESPRDGGGHGSHTASTAAGDYGVPARIYKQAKGRITGIAPAAKIAVYKVLWSAAGDSSSRGATSDILSGIDAAVGDGVDVINYSIGTTGGATDLLDAVSIAMLNAAASGVFVAASGGNDGPHSSTVDNVAPWVTTAAASTWRNPDGTVILGNGKRVLGASFNANGVGGRLVYARAVKRKNRGSDGASAAECGTGTLSRAKAHGTIILCDRGTSLFVQKLAEVRRVHAKGVVIGDVDQPDVVPLTARLPWVSVHRGARRTILDYLHEPGSARARLVPGNRTRHKTAPVPQVADFSSRGPSRVSGDVLKPDVAAPGVAVLAAVAPPSNRGLDFDFYDGTSMAAPHIAGLAAWVLGKHPHLGPAALRSAFMTTAHDAVTKRGRPGISPFAQGAGEVTATKLGDPGLIFPAGTRDWLSYLEGEGADTGTSAPARPSYNLNEASVQLSSVVHSVLVTRTVKNVSGRAETYRASYAGSRNVRVRFSHQGSFFKAPAYRVGAGKSHTFRIRVRALRGYGKWAMGHVLLTGSRHQVRIPLVAKPTAIDVPASVEGSGTSGAVTVDGRSGFDGTLTASARGMVGSVPTHGTVMGDSGSLSHAVVTAATVPSGTAISRVDLDAGTGSNDLDLYVFADDGTPFDPSTDPLVAVSASGSASERIVGKIPAGNYWVVVDGYDVAAGGGAYTLTTWNVPATDAGNLAVAPASQHVTSGEPFSVTGSYSGLDPNQVYFGWIRFTGGSQAARTFVTIRP